MASQYVINIGNASAKSWVQFSYEHTLNGMSSSQIALDGISSIYASEFDVDKEIYIYKSGTLVFRGLVVTQDSLNAGGIVLSIQGIEIELADSKSPMVGSLTTRAWSATSDDTIINTLVTSVSGWTTNVVSSTGTNVDFRTSATESVWNAVIRLAAINGKDIKIDQTNKIVYFYDELTRADKFSFIEGKNAYGISRNKTRSIAGKVLVYGKGDGDNQIVGSHGSSTPVYTIIDRNIVSNTEATARAVIEYGKLNPESKKYGLVPTSVGTLQVGDMGNIANNSAGINEEVDIVRIKTLVDQNGTEKIDMEVTNPDYRFASKNVAESRAKSEFNYNQSQSSMQGTTNVLTFPNLINANNTAPLRVHFQIPSSFMFDEVGTRRINSFTLDYDIDPYRKGVGDATVDDNTTGAGITNAQALTGAGITNNGQTPSSAAVNSSATAIQQVTSGSAGNGYISTVTVGTNSLSSSSITCQVNNTTGSSVTVNCNLTFPSTTTSAEGNQSLANNASRAYVVGESNAGNSSGWFLCWDSLFNASRWGGFMNNIYSHTHGSHTHSNSFNDANHTNSNSFNDANHDHTATIGDTIEDDIGLNATELSEIKVYWWNTSTTTWDLKHTITNTGETIESDLDLSNSNTLPDVAGFWKVEIKTNSASPDLVNGIVKIKHEIDN